MAKSLKQALQRPNNIAGRVPAPVNPGGANVPPVPQTIPRNLSSLAIATHGPAPAIFTTQSDSISQWNRPGTSQQRFPPLPSKSNPGINAQASSVASAANVGLAALATAASVGVAALQKQGFQGAWSSIVTYSNGAIVDFDGVLYVAIQAIQNQNLNQEPDTSPAFWQVTGSVAFEGAWSSTVTYNEGALVDYSGQIYISVQASNLNNTPSSSPLWWTATGSPNSSLFLGTWSSVTAYVIGNQVTYSGTAGNAYYIALANSTNKEPDTNPSDWQQIGSPNSYVFLGAYNGATAYVPGNQVSYIGSYWINISASTGNVPGVGSSFWEQIGQAAILLQPWSSATAYTQGMEVLYLGSIYQCILANTNEQPNISPAYWTLVSNPATAVGFQMISNPDFQNGLTNYGVYDNNSTGHVTLSLASNSAAPGGFGQTLEISVSAGGENPGLGGFNYATALDSGVVVLDHYHVGDTYIVSVWANIPVGYTLNFAHNSLGTGGSVTPISTSYAGTGGWVNYVWQVIVGTSPASPNSFPFFYLSGTFSTAFNWYAAQLSITDINQPVRGNQNLFLGAWSSITPYVPGNEVSNGGNYWTCLVANTNQTPPTPPTTSTYWMNVGPVSLGNLPDGPSRFAATGATLTYKPESNMLTAVDAGSNATIDVASWVNQVQGDAISYNSGSITALSYSTLYFVYMQDPTLAGGSPSGGYQATTNKYGAIAGSGNFFLGSIVTPSHGGANTNGFGDGGAGAQFGIAYFAGPGAQNYVGNAGSPATFTNQSFSMMGGPNNFATLSYTVPSTAARTNTYTLSNFALPQSSYTSLVLNIPTALPTNSATGTSAVWQVFYSLDGGISFTNVIDIIAGTTYAFTNTTVSLSATQNPAAIQVKYILATGTNTTSGTITADIYTPYITGAN